MEIVKIPFVLGFFDGIGESPCTVICPMRCGDLTSNPSNLYSISVEALFGCSGTSGGYQ